MSKLPVVSGQKVVKALSKKGFVMVRQRGSHMVIQRVELEGTKTIPVPNHNELAKGTLRAILRKAEISIDEFIELL